MNYPHLLDSAIRAALAAGVKILEVYESDNFDVTRKDDDSPLTKADLQSQETISKILLDKTPYPMLGEEGREIPYEERAKWETFWLVDPLDGTKEFVKQNGEFTVNIALVSENTSVLGVLYVPVKDILYFAYVDGGAYRIEHAREVDVQSIPEKAVRLPDQNDRKTPPVVIVASRSHYSDETKAFVERIKAEHGEVDLISAGSALKICLVAEGKADYYPRLAPTMEWDVGAGQIIAEEAGCSLLVVDTNEPLRYNRENLVNPHFIVQRI